MELNADHDTLIQISHKGKMLFSASLPHAYFMSRFAEDNQLFPFTFETTDEETGEKRRYHATIFIATNFTPAYEWSTPP
jgi:hypothetical protein